MKTRILLAVFLLLSSVTFFSCVKGDFDEPPIFIPKVDFDANSTIAELKAIHTVGQPAKLIVDDIIISGIIVANDESGNLYKKMILQDGSAGIELALDKTSLYNEYKLGQRVFIKCKDMYIGDYNGLIQLGYLYNGAIGRLPEIYIVNHLFRDSLPGAKPEPQLLATIGAVNASLISKLVRFENVRFAETGVEWAPQSADATNRAMLDAGNNRLEVRTSKYSNFAGNLVPMGTGEITGVLSIFGTTYQLTIRDTADIKNFTGVEPPPPGSGTGTFEDPYDVLRAMIKTGETGKWAEGYIVGVYETDVDPFVSNFSAPFRTNSNLLLAPTAGETNLASCLTVQLPAGQIRTALNLVNTPENKGKIVKIYGNLEAYFSQPGIKTLTGYWLDGAGIIPGGGGGGTGTGTMADPYNVEAAVSNQNATPYVVGWVKGFIVGSVKSGVTAITSADDIHFTGPFTLATNVLLADSPTETDYLKCVVVNLPSGKPLRAAVNLMDNPDNLGKWLNVTGTLRTYFSIAGLRDCPGETTDFELQDGGGGGGNSIFLENFNTTLGVFTAHSIAGDQVWGWGSFDGGCAVMSGFVTPSNYANEDWLVSPAISLAGQTGVTMNFREAINYITNISDMKVLLSTNYDGTSSPATNGTWTELTGFTRAAGNNWTFVNSGDVSLTAYESQTIYIAFKFLSYTTGSGTWEISKVEVKN